MQQLTEGVLVENPQEVEAVEQQGYMECPNPRCTFYLSPEVQQHYMGIADAIDYGGATAEDLNYTCQHCGHTFNVLARPGQNNKKFSPGGATISGLPVSVQGQLGEDAVEQLGETDLAGYGPIKWWHHGGASSPSHLDGAVAEWGVEVKTIDWKAENWRGIVNAKDQAAKLRAAQDIRWFADMMQDPALDKVIDQLNIKGILGVLVILNFASSTADIYVREFPSEIWGHNQFGKPLQGIKNWRHTTARYVASVPFDNPLPDPKAPDFVPYHQREKDEGFGAFSSWRFADGGWGGDAYPGEEPEIVADRSYDEGMPTGGEYKFVYGNGELRVSPDDDHRALQGYIGIDDGYTGPFAVGYVHVDNDNATWEVNTNVGLSAMHRILKDYTDKVGWKWHGLTDINGQPINDDFAPKKGGNDNVIKRHEDLEQWNIYDPTPNDDQRNPDERQPGGVFKCPDCGRLFPDWRTYTRHRDEELGPENTVDPDSGFPELNNDAIFRPHFTEQQPFTDVVAAKAPKDMIEDPVPFIYDIEEDAIYTGHPGAKHSDIHGEFTPGGIVEGVYEPGGKVSLRTMTNMPYTVRHLIELWYWQHPEFEVRGVWLEDEQGGRTKLAADNPGPYIKTLVSADPAAWSAHKALSAAGGKVYAVGGAVRDVLLDKQPKDIDLMVQGLPADAVRRALEALPGRVDLTGKDFGVFRYKNHGYEVEIALPRRERSTGEGHQDFDVQADHTMSVEEDLKRRDFTANAAAVDLDTGKLIDPFNGKQDIQDRVLRTVTPKAFEEDPLRTVRALVAHARHGLHPDPRTKAQMTANADRLSHLPAERIQAELDKIFSSKDPASAIRLARESGVLKHILPEVDEAFGFDQNNPHHAHDLGTHLLNVLEHTQEKTDDPDLRLAALLHDIGKPGSAWTNPETGYNHYYRGPNGEGDNHEELGARLAEARLKALKYPTRTTERVRDLITHHMYPDFSSSKGARKFVNRVGDHADDLMLLREADRGGKGTDEYQDKKTPVEVQRGLVAELRQRQEPTKQSDLAINGNDLIQLGYQPGPELGAKLRELTDLVVEDPSLNQRATLLEMASA